MNDSIVRIVRDHHQRVSVPKAYSKFHISPTSFPDATKAEHTNPETNLVRASPGSAHWRVALSCFSSGERGSRGACSRLNTPTRPPTASARHSGCSRSVRLSSSIFEISASSPPHSSSTSCHSGLGSPRHCLSATGRAHATGAQPRSTVERARRRPTNHRKSSGCACHHALSGRGRQRLVAGSAIKSWYSKRGGARVSHTHL